MSNGEAMAKAVQGMNQDEKLVFLISEVGNIKTALSNNAEVLGRAVSDINDMKIELVKLPSHCVHEDDFVKMCHIRNKLNDRLYDLEKDSAARKAVSRVWLGTGSVGIVGGILAILKFIFEVI